MRQLLLLICIFSFSSLPAQRKFAKEEKWSTSLTGALLPFPQVNVGIQPGVEYRFNDRLSLLTEITFRVWNSSNADKEVVNKKYFRIQPELRYVFSGRRRIWDSYAGLRCSYAFRKFRDEHYGFYAAKELPQDSVLAYDKGEVKSPIATSSLQLGTVFFPEDHLSLDLFIGLGARFTNTSFSGLVNPHMSYLQRAPDGPMTDPAYQHKGVYTQFHGNFGLRFIWHLY